MTSLRAAGVCVFLVACSDTHVLSGAFRSTEPLTVPGAPGVSGKYAELVLGHYGPDVAGLVWLCADADCTARGACGHIERGHWSDADVLTFSFVPPGGCDPLPEGVDCVVLASLTLHGEDTLRGVLFLGDAMSQETAFEREKREKDLVRDDLTCPPEAQL